MMLPGVRDVNEGFKPGGFRCKLRSVILEICNFKFQVLKGGHELGFLSLFWIANLLE